MVNVFIIVRIRGLPFSDVFFCLQNISGLMTHRASWTLKTAGTQNKGSRLFTLDSASKEEEDTLKIDTLKMDTVKTEKIVSLPW
jgi:hypothetical protein